MLKDEKGVVSVWLGTVRSRKRWGDYLEEQYSGGEDDDRPISQFAEDLGETFYDHDFLESGWRKTPLPVAELLTGGSYSESYRPAALAACAKLGLTTANVVVTLHDQRAVMDADAEYQVPLTLVGTFPYEIPRHPSEPAPRPGDHQERVTATALAGEVALTATLAGAISLWRLQDGACLGELPREAGTWIGQIRFDAGARRALIAGDSMALWEAGVEPLGQVTPLDTGRESSTGQVAAITRDGVLAAGATEGFTVVFWDLASRSQLGAFKEDFGPITAMSWSPDQRHLFVGNDRGIMCCFDVTAPGCAWKARVHDVPQRKHATIVDIAIDASCRVGLSGGFVACLFDPRDGSVLRKLDSPDEATYRRVVAVHLRGGRAFVVEEAGRIAIYDVDSGRAAGAIQAHDATVRAATFSPDGKLLVTGSADRTLRIWDLDSAKLLAQYPATPNDLPESEDGEDHPTAISALATDGTHVIAGEDSGRVHILALRGAKLHSLRD